MVIMFKNKRRVQVLASYDSLGLGLGLGLGLVQEG